MANIAAAITAINAKYASFGGSSGFLGAPTSLLIADTGASGFHINYKPGTAIYWSPDTGAHSIGGAIGGRWLANGGPQSNFGYPTTDEAATADGICRFTYFSGQAGIFWTQATGACLIYGEIFKKWFAQGAEKSGIGYPITDETSTVDGKARFNNFKSGAIYFTAAGGAVLIYGSIFQKWTAQGGVTSGMGIPITDETSSGDGTFRYNLFQNSGAICASGSTGTCCMIYGEIYKKWISIGGLATGDFVPITDELLCVGGKHNELKSSYSLYYTVVHGAFLIYGDIRKKWLSFGGPDSWMGLPISDEMPLAGGGRTQQFENAALQWHGSYDTMTAVASGQSKSFGGNIISGGLAALGGLVTVTIHDTGIVRWNGSGHDGSLIDGYKYGVTAVLRPKAGSSQPPIAFVHHGHVGGAITSGSKDDPWDEYQVQSFILDGFADYVAGTMAVSTAYSSELGDIFESLLSDVATWTVGSLLGPVGLIAFVGVEIASYIETGSLVPGARVLNGILWMAGPENTLLAILASAIATIGSKSRKVTPDEYKFAQDNAFKNSLPPIKRLRITDTIGPDNRCFTVPMSDGTITLNLGPEGFSSAISEKFTNNAYPDKGQIFLHELTHSWQIQHTPMRAGLMAKALLIQLQGKSAYIYGAAGAKFNTFNLEQQAQIVGDWAVGYDRKTKKTGKAGDTTSPYWMYIVDNIQTGQY
jgi:hypothetical protein